MTESLSAKSPGERTEQSPAEKSPYPASNELSEEERETKRKVEADTESE